MSQKSYNNTPALYLIPTPIGNMDDITIRALNTLKEVELVLSEDTRVTGLLMKHFDIKKRLVANHEHNEEKNKNLVKNLLEEGKSIGLVSDRGTPVISDPGFEIAKYVIELGYNVIPLPGATALIPALISSGLDPMPFTFYGFLNSKESKRKKELELLKKVNHTMIFYEAPHRITDTLNNILEVFGNRKMCLAREISKKYEEIYRGTISDVIKETENIKGEIVFLVEGNKEVETFDDLSVIDHVNMFIEDGLSQMDAIKKVAKLRKIPKSDVYNQYHK
jgi:16S rRNA (cytidine1402-2'-O)-methyltransferase